jgi:anion-transporting  ArsA/GET3 family ATPase
MDSRAVTASVPVSSAISRNLVFVSGKGGVGKTTVSQAIAQGLAEKGKRTLWTTFEDPTRPLGEIQPVGPNLWHLNCEATQAFEEYAALKIGVAKLAKLFLQNKLMRYLAKAAPGIHELVLLGKVWHERLNYDHVVIDMPSTGYGLAMFQSTVNFANLFKGGPVHRDAEEMLATFRSARETGHLIVALPEEMPLREALELNEFMRNLFPANPPSFLANRKFPQLRQAPENLGAPDDWATPVPTNLADYAAKRAVLEEFNLRIWRDREIVFGELPYLLGQDLRPQMTKELAARKYL